MGIYRDNLGRRFKNSEAEKVLYIKSDGYITIHLALFSLEKPSLLVQGNLSSCA